MNHPQHGRDIEVLHKKKNPSNYLLKGKKKKKIKWLPSERGGKIIHVKSEKQLI